LTIKGEKKKKGV